MKQLSLLFTLFFSQFLVAYSELEPFRPQYEVVSDVKDSYITNGRCILEISVRDRNSNMELENVTIISGKKKHKTNSIGFVKFSQSIAVKHLEFQLENYATGYVEGYEFKSKHRIKINVYLVNQLEEIHYNVKKPVIYCYSDKDLSFKFDLKPKGDLLFNYPKLDIGLHMINPSGQTQKTYSWTMSLKNNRLFANDSLEYPYLFWEAKQTGIQYKTFTTQSYLNQYLVMNEGYEGVIIRKDEVVNYLDSILTYVGLNATEKTDFITFWAPQMMKQNFYLIQFLQDDSCEQFASYQIEPKPAKVNRLYMLFSGFESHPNCPLKAQDLKKLDRNGFYMVDWGGVEVPLLIKPRDVDYLGRQFNVEVIEVKN